MPEINTIMDYLFVAELFNGGIIRQDQQDKSKTAIGSAFTDVLKEKVKKFSLVGKGHIFTVDLTNGHIEIDGRVVYPPRLPPEQCELHLIYYRQVQQRMGIDPETNKPLEPIMKYFLGWQTNYKGKNYKFEMGIE